jgi:protein MAK11
VEVGTLIQHQATITCLDFYQHVVLLSGAADGTICIWDVAAWDLLKTMKGHV